MDFISQSQPTAGYHGHSAIPGDESELGFGQLFDIIGRNALLMAVITVSIFVVALGTTFLMEPSYFAAAAVKLDPAARAVGASEIRSVAPQAEQARMDTEVQIIQSRQIAQQTINALRLDTDAELLDEAAAETETASSPEDRMVDAFLKRLDVQRNADDYVVHIGYASSQPAKAAQVANAVARAYVEHTVADRNSTASEQARWLSGRLETLGGEIQSDQARIAQLRARTGIAGTTAAGTVTDQQIGPLSMELAQAESEAAAAGAELAAAKAQIGRGDIGSVTGVLTSPVIADLRRQRAEASQMEAEISTRYGAKHPEHARIERQLAQLEAALQSEANRIVAGLQGRVNSARARVASLRGSLGSIRGEQSANARASAVADTLTQQAGAKQDSYDQLASRLEQVLQDQRDLMPTATIIEEAVPPVLASSPNRMLFSALGVILGLIVSFTTIFLKEVTNTRIISSHDLAKATMLPFIATVPALEGKQLVFEGQQVPPEDYIQRKPMSAFAEAFRTLRNDIMFSDTKPRVISVVSSLPGEGKTTVAAGLARIMALSGDRVVLVDCDLRRGRLRELAQASPSHGLVEVLSKEMSWREALIKDGLCDLDILPCKAQTFIPEDVLSTPTMMALIEDLRREYDFVVLDTPPALAVADSRTVATLADASIFVARSNRTPASAAALATEQFAHDRSLVLGTVLTMATSKAKRSRHDPYYYSNAYRGYVEA